MSIVGQYQAVGPVAAADGPIDPEDAVAKPTRQARLAAARRQRRGARRPRHRLAATTPRRPPTCHAPVLAPEDLDARLVLDTPADLKAWLDGKELTLPAPTGDQPRTVPVRLTRGDHELVLRVAGGAKAGLVTTFVAAKPLEFRTGEGPAVSGAEPGVKVRSTGRARGPPRRFDRARRWS